MYNFKEEELLVIAQYPKQAIEYANKQMQGMFNAHKPITNPFKWFCSVCESFLKKQSNKTPETGNSQPHARPKIGPQSVWKKEERATEGDFEWCMAVEPRLHEFVLANHPGLKLTRPFADAKFERLTAEQQQYIMNTVHIDCNCRESSTKGDAQPVTFCHDLNMSEQFEEVLD